jgi:astacin
MAAIVFALISLCLAFTVYGIPVSVKISPPEPQTTQNEDQFEGTNPQMLGGGLEGDMIFAKGINPKSLTRGVAIFGNMKWPNNVIPYDISAITNANDQKTITDAMNKLMYDVGTPIANSQQRTACVFFRPRQSTDKNYFKIQYGNGCSAHVGHVTGIQPTMTLQQNGCFYSKTIQHELMHVIGFFHEQSRPDRDDFLQINLQNVESSMAHNFNKYTWGATVFNQGSTYDYASIMHYDTTAFSMNGKPTMVPRKAGAVIGKAEALSPMDIAEVRHLLGCQA